jgi:DNA-binding NarL/FixJ family response regulator
MPASRKSAPAKSELQNGISKQIRILIADDHGALLDMVMRTVSNEFDVVGTAGDGRELLDETERLNPDVLIVDISLPVMSGIEAVRLLNRTHPAVKVVFLTVHENAEYARQAFAVGALGYVVKSRMASDLVDAIKAALIGHRFVSPSVTL